MSLDILPLCCTSYLFLGRVVLKRLKIDVSWYVASEIDEEAKIVGMANHQDIVYVCDVRKITMDTLKKYMPIDLLIGGSPCNDFSSANPDRKGLTGVKIFNQLKNFFFQDFFPSFKKRLKFIIYTMAFFNIRF